LHKKIDGSKYYAYLIAYVDDVLAIDESPDKIMKQLGQLYRLKGDIEFPKLYLGTNIKRWEFEDGGKTYAMGSDSYCKEAIRVSKQLHTQLSMPPLSNSKNSGDESFHSSSYCLELDSSEHCNYEQMNAY